MIPMKLRWKTDNYQKWYKSWYEKNREKRLIQYRTLNTIKREQLFNILGHVCIKCGFSDKRALQFDHINGGGLHEQKRFGGQRKMVEYYIKNPIEAKEKLQTLCANCNWIKRCEDKELQYPSL